MFEYSRAVSGSVLKNLKLLLGWKVPHAPVVVSFRSELIYTSTAPAGWDGLAELGGAQGESCLLGSVQAGKQGLALSQQQLITALVALQLF